MTKVELIDRIWIDFDRRFTKGEISLLIDKVFDQISNEVVKNKSVRIHNFGTFFLKQIKTTKKFLIGKKKVAQIPTRYKIKFSPSLSLNKKVPKIN